MSTAVSSSVDWQSGFLTVLPAVETHAKIQFRKLRPEQREDAIQEAIASACVSYQILAAKNRLHDAKPATIATFAVNYVRNHRHVGGHQNVRDVMSPLCQHRHGTKVVGDSDGWKLIAVEDRNANVP